MNSTVVEIDSILYQVIVVFRFLLRADDIFKTVLLNSVFDLINMHFLRRGV